MKRHFRIAVGVVCGSGLLASLTAAFAHAGNSL